MRAIRQTTSVTAESFVVQGNQMARSRYGDKANIHSLRLVAAAMAKVDTDMDMLGQITISASELRSVFPAYASTNRLSEYVSDAVDRMMGMRAESWEGDGSWAKVNVVTSAVFKAGKGGLTLTFHPDMQQYLLRLTGNYTKYQLGAISKLETSSQFLVYQFLKSHQHHGSVLVSVADFRKLLGIEEDEYKEYKSFRIRVLDKNIEAINESTDIQVSYEQVKLGRTIGSLLFKITRNGGSLTIFEKSAMALLHNVNISQKAAEQAVSTMGAMPCLRMIAAVRARAEDKTVKDVTAYLAHCLRKGLRLPTDKLPNYEQHLARVYLDFRLHCFYKMEPREQEGLLRMYAATLTESEKEQFSARGERGTPVLQNKFNEFLRGMINPENPNFRMTTD